MIIEITKLGGITLSEVKVISGLATDIQAGDLFELINWGIPDRPSLYVHIPSDKLSYYDVMAIAGEFEKFSSNNNIRLVTDPDKEDATHFLFYTLEGWVLMDNKGVKNNIGKDFSFTRLNKLITPGKSSIYMELPPFKSMLDSLV